MSAAVMLDSRGAAQPGRLTVLAAGREPDPGILARLREIAARPGVESVLALPDLHQKARTEVPSSLAITTRDTLVPEFTSVAINDGMGLVMTDLDARAMTPERVVRFLARVNAHAAAHVMDANRYSLSAGELAAAALEGAPAGARRYGLDPAIGERMDLGGRVRVPGGREVWDDQVPALLRRTRMGRSEMGLNFGGNHFLEVQAVDRVLDPAAASRAGLDADRVGIMYHLGPGPFSGTLLHHFTRREILTARRAPLFFLSKLLLHAGRGARRVPVRRRWGLHFRRNGWTPYDPASEEGVRMRQALALAMNVGFVYRLATVAAIRDALLEVFGPAAGPRLVNDIAHNSLFEEPRPDGVAWVARHNACRVAPGGPVLVAGAHDVPSYFGRGGAAAAGELHSCDHGAGHLIAERRERGRLAPASGVTVRLRMSRGARGRVLERELLPLREAEPIERLLECLEARGILRPAVRLRPLGTLKN